MQQDAAKADSINHGGGGADSPALPDPLITGPLCADHRIRDFSCKLSERITGFFHKEAAYLVPGNYCRVFVAPDPNDPTHIWGYYTLSAALLVKEHLSNSDEKKAVREYLGYPAPMVRIGFMGRDDTSPKGFGRGLLIDAARRVHRNEDIAAWGLVLESEGGEQNAKLWKWYQEQGFKPCRKTPNSMYGSLAGFIPELHG